MFVLRNFIIGIALLSTVITQHNFAQAPKTFNSKSVERGRYLVKITGCNDCHTPGYIQASGKIPEKQWLIGDQLGWRGPWGTTYPSNLRLYMQNLSEDQWVKVAKTAQYRPPMPWFALHEMTTQDLRAIYRFIKYLGAAGELAPVFVPPGQKPKGPYVLFPEPPK
ncbi:c-type cytochrome [Rosettibacter firmus]|uniref:c-type cytochrome n=1 Tax=Rosettibacter firmus TaxID=3111522 RepID=UPI00336C1E0C